MAAPTFDDLMESWLEWQDFDNETVLTAKALVDRIIGGNEVTRESEEAYRCAVCAAAMKLQEYGELNQSVSLGAFSIGAAGEGGGGGMAAQAALDYLVPAGLAFAGV